MRTSIQVLSNQQFLRIRLEPVTQKGKQFYVSVLAAKDLLSTFTVAPAEYDVQKHQALAEGFKDDADYYQYLISKDKDSIAEKDFQREKKDPRVREIADFLLSEEYALFPNTIIVTCDLLNDELAETDIRKFAETPELQKSSIQTGRAFLDNNDGPTLYVPYRKGTILVIDGQHRLVGIERALQINETGLGEYDLLTTFILGFDRSAVAQLFYTVNYNQKSVNKSLLYHLSGEFSREIDATTFLHEVVKLLNELPKSAFRGRIKILGIRPKDLDPVLKARMTVSQAFLIDYLLSSISESSLRSNYQPVFLYYFRKKEFQIEIARFLLKYFTAVSKISEGWESPDASVISKTVSIGAFIKLLQVILLKMFIDEFALDPTKISTVTVARLQEILLGAETIDFSAAGPYGGISSAGTVGRLTKELIEKIQYFGKRPSGDVLAELKTEYKPKFSEWLQTALNESPSPA